MVGCFKFHEVYAGRVITYIKTHKAVQVSYGIEFGWIVVKLVNFSIIQTIKGYRYQRYKSGRRTQNGFRPIHTRSNRQFGWVGDDRFWQQPW